MMVFVLGAAVTSPLFKTGGGHQTPLTWSPPRLVAPTTISLPTTSAHLQLNPAKDYILKLPAAGLTGSLWIEGGHNVVMIGGTITVPSTANQTDNGADNTDTGIYVKNATGTVHIEGVAIGAQTNVMFDGIDINAPLATVQIENVRITKLWGSDTMMHADAVQTWGGVGTLRIDRLSADGDYQGLTIDPDLGPVGNVDIQDTDLTIDPIPSQLLSESKGGGHMIWLTKGASTCNAPSSVTLQNVYVNNTTTSLGLSPADLVWPQATNTNLSCASVDRNGSFSWPHLPVTGTVTLGAPPGGQFVPAGVAGSNYVSPGYLP